MFTSLSLKDLVYFVKKISSQLINHGLVELPMGIALLVMVRLNFRIARFTELVLSLRAKFHSIWFKHFIGTQTRQELIQMDINKMMTNGIFTINDKHTQTEHELNRLQNHAVHCA